MPQIQLPIFPDGAVEINPRIAVIKKNNNVIWFNGSLPIFSHDIDDLASFRLHTSQLYVNGAVTQSEICRSWLA